MIVRREAQKWGPRRHVYFTSTPLTNYPPCLLPASSDEEQHCKTLDQKHSFHSHNPPSPFLLPFLCFLCFYPDRYLYVYECVLCFSISLAFSFFVTFSLLPHTWHVNKLHVPWSTAMPVIPLPIDTHVHIFYTKPDLTLYSSFVCTLYIYIFYYKTTR